MFSSSLDHKTTPFQLLPIEFVEANVEIKDVETKEGIKIDGVDGAITFEQEASPSHNWLS